MKKQLPNIVIIYQVKLKRQKVFHKKILQFKRQNNLSKFLLNYFASVQQNLSVQN